MPQPNLWEQRDDEAAAPYSAFKHYRDAGDARSYKATAEALGKSRQLIERWAFQYDWQRRVRSQTRALEAEATRARQKRYKSMYDTHAGLATLLIAKAAARIKAIDPLDLKVSQALAFVKLGVSIERDARAFDIHERVQGPQDAAEATAARIAALPKVQDF